jgi:autotransporter-associated beta strand protein
LRPDTHAHSKPWACHPIVNNRLAHRRIFACALAASAALVNLSGSAPAYDLHFDYTSFETGFQQAQFNVLNYPRINGAYMMTSTDNHRPEMVANGNALAEFYNNFNADYNHPTAERRTPAEEAAHINTYTLNNSTNNGARPEWLILNEISSSQWQLNPGVPSLSEHRSWVIDTVTLLADVYGYKVVTYSPYETVGTANAASWQALAAKSYIGIESYQSGTEVWNSGATNAARLAWVQGKYQSSKNTYLAAGVPESRLFISEHFANNAATYVDNQGITRSTGWGRAGLASAADWDQVIMMRQDAMKNVGFAGFLAYNWGGNAMGITQAEQIQHEYYYRSRLVLPGQKPQWLSDSAINVNGTTIPLSWNQPLNWIGGVPNANGAAANFWRTLTASRSITLDGSKTIGTILFDSPYSYTISPGTGGSLVLNNSGSAATITSNQGSHNINVNVLLTSSLTATVSTNTLTMGGVVSGSGSLTKSGAGTLVLSAVNSYTGNTTVGAGKLTLNNRFLADAADVYVSTGATLDLKFSGIADIIDSLFLNGVPQAVGIWGASGSGAQFTTPLLIGPGMLQVSKFVPPPLVGDYNQDGVVTGADYATWRDSVGATSIANRDPNNTGLVGQADYATWRAQYGNSVLGAGSGSSNNVAVPEPTCVALICSAVIVSLARRRKSSSSTRVAEANFAK